MRRASIGGEDDGVESEHLHGCKRDPISAAGGRNGGTRLTLEDKD